MIIWQSGSMLKSLWILATWSKKVHCSLLFVGTCKFTRRESLERVLRRYDVFLLLNSRKNYFTLLKITNPSSIQRYQIEVRPSLIFYKLHRKEWLDAKPRLFIQEETNIAIFLNWITRENSNQRKGYEKGWFTATNLPSISKRFCCVLPKKAFRPPSFLLQF